MLVRYLFPEKRNKVLTFSYDDGNCCDRHLADIFTASNMKATFNINSGFMEQNGKLGAADLQKLVAEGHEIACHGQFHPFEDQILPASLIEDIVEDRKRLEKVTNTIVNGMAYPNGTYSPCVFTALRAVGIKYCRTTGHAPRLQYFPQNWLEWHPTCHHNEDILTRAKDFIENPFGLQMLYIWGHAYEFDRNNNWEIIEKFCALLENRSEIWYATNKQIYEYIEACRNIESSIDSRCIYNPSSIPVWLMIEEKIVIALPGKFVTI